jgi:hypothetical protein
MYRTFIRAVGVAVVVVATTALTASAASAQTAPAARIHLLHGIPDVTVDVYAGGEAVFEDFAFGDTQDLSALAGETLTDVEVRVAGTEDVAIDAGDVQLPGSGNHTVVAHLDADGTPTLAAFANDTATTAAGQGRLTVRHAAAAPAVDVLADGQAAFTNVVNGQEGKADLPVGTISASVVPTGATEPVVIGPADLAIEDGRSLIVYAVGSLEDDSLSVLTESITGIGSAPTLVATGNSPVEESSGASRVWLVTIVGAALLVAAGGFGARRLATLRSR